MAFKVPIEQAAKELDRKLRGKSWYLSLGIGDLEEGVGIYVYVKTARNREVAKLGRSWMGYKLVVEPVGSIRPALSQKQLA